MPTYQFLLPYWKIITDLTDMFEKTQSNQRKEKYSPPILWFSKCLLVMSGETFLDWDLEMFKKSLEHPQKSSEVLRYGQVIF